MERCSVCSIFPAHDTSALCMGCIVAIETWLQAAETTDELWVDETDYIAQFGQE